MSKTVLSRWFIHVSYTAMKDIAVDKDKFDALLKKIIASKPVTFKELVKNPKQRSGKPKGVKK